MNKKQWNALSNTFFLLGIVLILLQLVYSAASVYSGTESVVWAISRIYALVIYVSLALGLGFRYVGKYEEAGKKK